MRNAKDELLEHIENRKVKHVHIIYGDYFRSNEKIISGSLESVIERLDFEYDSGYGGQELFGHIWYQDGTWSSRGEYDGSEWWEHNKCPEIPEVQ